MMEKGHTIPVLDHGYVRYIDHLGSDQRILEAARISYKSPSKGEEADRKLLGYLWNHKHTSPFEQCSITLNVKMPIFVMRQWVRHRTAKLNEMSARYTELPEEFYVPTQWRAQDTKNKQGSTGGFGESTNEYFSKITRQHTAEAFELYHGLLEDGVARELARMVLPVNVYTEIYWTMDLHNLLHFLRLREDSHAQWEIQKYGLAIREILEDLFPWTMGAYDKTNQGNT